MLSHWLGRRLAGVSGPWVLLAGSGLQIAYAIWSRKVCGQRACRGASAGSCVVRQSAGHFAEHFARHLAGHFAEHFTEHCASDFAGPFRGPIRRPFRAPLRKGFETRVATSLDGHGTPWLAPDRHAYVYAYAYMRVCACICMHNVCICMYMHARICVHMHAIA